MYPGVDFLSLEERLKPEEKQVRDVVRRFVEREFDQQACQLYEQGRFPRELVPKMAELGLLGASLTGYGPSRSQCDGLRASHAGTRTR